MKRGAVSTTTRQGMAEKELSTTTTTTEGPSSISINSITGTINSTTNNGNDTSLSSPPPPGGGGSGSGLTLNNKTKQTTTTNSSSFLIKQVFRWLIKENPKMKDLNQGSRIHYTISIVSFFAMIYFGGIAVPSVTVTVDDTIHGITTTNIIDSKQQQNNDVDNINNDNYDDNNSNYDYYYYSQISLYILSFGFFGLILDNMITGLGKYIGPNQSLKRLTQLRLIFHGVGIPLFFIPIVHIAKVYGGIMNSTTTLRIIVASIGISFIELITWSTYNIQQLIIVDNRQSFYHTPHTLSGTLTYTSGEFLKLVLPVILLTFYQLIVGLLLIGQSIFTTTSSSSIDSGSNGNQIIMMEQQGYVGSLILISSLIALITAGLNRPDIQLWGEVVWLALVGIALM